MKFAEDLKTYLEESNLENWAEVNALIDQFSAIEQVKYNDMKKDNKLTFGKCRG